MPALLAWLLNALGWIGSSFVGKWVAAKVFAISVVTIVLPWVLKDGLQWFWRVTEKYRLELLLFINQQISSVLTQLPDNLTVSLMGVAGYIANQIGLVNYFSIIMVGYGVCWSLKLISRFI